MTVYKSITNNGPVFYEVTNIEGAGIELSKNVNSNPKSLLVDWNNYINQDDYEKVLKNIFDCLTIEELKKLYEQVFKKSVDESQVGRSDVKSWIKNQFKSFALVSDVVDALIKLDLEKYEIYAVQRKDCGAGFCLVNFDVVHKLVTNEHDELWWRQVVYEGVVAIKEHDTGEVLKELPGYYIEKDLYNDGYKELNEYMKEHFNAETAEMVISYK